MSSRSHIYAGRPAITTFTVTQVMPYTHPLIEQVGPSGGGPDTGPQYGPGPQYSCGETEDADNVDAPAPETGVIRSPTLMEITNPSTNNL